MEIYHYPGCSTCKKALKWLDAQGLSAARVHIVEEPPSAQSLEDLWRRSGLPLRRFFNTSGVSYRAGGFKERLATMSDEEAIAALAADGKLIKRPLMDTGGVVLVGFKAEEWARALGGGGA